MARWKKLVRLLTDRSYADRLIRGRVYGIMRNRLGMSAPMLTEDRRILEQIVFPHYSDNPCINSVLFVGCDPYTAHYQRRYFNAHDYWTIDPDATRQRFGAQQHLIVRLQELDRYFPADFFDLVIFNGVYGWGLNSVEDCNTAVAQCHFCLRDAGHMVVGWNDVPDRDPAPLSQVSALSRFSEYFFPPLGGWQYLTDTNNRHTFRFYQKIDGRDILGRS